MPSTAKPYLIQTDHGQTRFILPPRTRHLLGILAGLFFMVATLAILVLFAILFWFLPAFPLRQLDLTLWAAVLVLALPKAASLYLFPGHAQITLASDKLITAHTGRGKKDSTSIDYCDIARLEIEAPTSLRARLLLHYPTLSAELPTGKRAIVVANYPRQILQILADDLQPLLESARSRLAPDPDFPADSAPAPVDIVDVSSIPRYQRDVLAPPPGSKITAVSTGDVFTFHIAHWGFFGTLLSVIFFSLIMLAIAAVPAALIIALLETNPINRPDGSNLVIAIAACLIPVPLALILLAIRGYSRKAVIVASSGPVEDAALVWTARSIFGSQERHWSRHQLRGVSTATGAAAGSFRLQSRSQTPPVRLVLRDARGHTITLVDGPELDIRFLATQLRQILNLPRF